MTQVSMHSAQIHFAALIKKVIAGEEVIITKKNEPIAKLTALITSKHKRSLGSAKGLVKIATDFNAPLDDFKDYQ